jgi:hypothetical protein
MLFPIDLIGQLGFFRTIFDYAYYVRRPDSLAHCTEPVSENSIAGTKPSYLTRVYLSARL